MIYFFIKDSEEKLEFWHYGGFAELVVDELPNVHIDKTGNVVDNDGAIILPAGEDWPETGTVTYKNRTVYSKYRKDLTQEEKRAIDRYNRRTKKVRAHPVFY